MFFPHNRQRKELLTMFRPAGYTTNQGFIGFLPDGTKMYFPTSNEYYEYVDDLDESNAFDLAAAPMAG